MVRTHQQGWVAWAFSAVLFATSATIAWFYYDASAANDQLQRDLNSTENAKQAAERRADRSESELETLRTQLSAALADLSKVKADQQALNTKLTRFETDSERSSQRVNDLQSNNEALSAQLAESSAQQQDLASKVTELQALLELRDSELEQAQSMLDQNETQLAEYQQTLSALRGELSEAATTEELYLAAREQLALKQSENETYTETIDRLKTEMAQESAAMTELESKLQSQLAKLNQEKEKLVTQLEDGTTAIKLPESILFASGSAELNEDGLKSLSVLANALASFPNHLISIQGHSDSRQISKSTSLIYPTNWELSSARAASAVRELLKKGIPAAQLQAVGFADTRPLVKETNAATRQQNRRIEVILFPNQFKTKVLQ